MKPNFVTPGPNGTEMLNLIASREKDGKKLYILLVYSRSLLYAIHQFNSTILADGNTFSDCDSGRKMYDDKVLNIL
jgi:hypothetical protein